MLVSPLLFHNYFDGHIKKHIGKSHKNHINGHFTLAFLFMALHSQPKFGNWRTFFIVLVLGLFTVLVF